MTVPTRTPKAKEVACCVNRLYEEVKSKRPRVVLALGKIAYKALLNINNAMADARGTVHYKDQLGAYVVTTYHPAAILRNPRLYRDMVNDFIRAKEVLDWPVGGRTSIEIKHRVLNDEDEVIEFLTQTERNQDVSYDVETASDGSLLCIGLSVSPCEAVVLSQRAVDTVNHTLLNDWLANKTCIAHNGKFDMRVMWKNGFPDVRTGADTMLQAYVMDGSVGGHGLEHLVREVLDYHEPWKLVMRPYKKKGFEHAPADVLYDYNAKDAALTLLLARNQEERLSDDDKHVLTTLMYPVADVLAEMEHLGVMVDEDYLNQLDVGLRDELIGIVQEMYDLVGKVFNPNSWQQLQKVLYDDLKLPVPGWLGMRTNEDALESILQTVDHPFPKLLLRYRNRKKFHGTYVRGLMNAADSNWRVHTTFNQHVTVTGRLSSSNPVNLQNIPRGKEARNIFIATPGYELVEVDLSQAEIRGWCWYSRDEVLRGAITSGLDTHTATACLMYDLKPEAVTKELRTDAKRLAFATLYQMQAESLALELNTTVVHAVELQDKFFGAYSRGREWINEVQQQVLRDGYFVTPFCRTLRFPIAGDKSSLMRDAANWPVQSLASDITLTGLLRIHDRIKVGELGDTRMLLTVHDSILVETKEDTGEIALACRNEMERDVLDGYVPFKADAKYGKSWGEMTDC